MIEYLKEKLLSVIPVSEELWEEMNNQWKEIHVRKGEKLVCFGDLNTKVFFVASGSLEISLILSDGSSKPVWFFLDELFNFATTQDSVFLGTPTKYELTALEDSMLLQADSKLLDATADKYLELNTFKAEVLLQDIILINEIRNHIITYKPLDFVKYLYDSYPIFIERHNANFMGITPDW